MNKPSVFTFVFLICIFSLLHPFVRAGERKEKTALVPRLMWVSVKNPNPVSSGNAEFVYGDTCSIQEGGDLKVLSTTRDRHLVRYSISIDAYGAQCPSGVLFFIDKAVFFRMGEYYHRIKKAKE